MSKEKTSCYTYFKITGTFSPDEITQRLGLEPSEKWCIGDYRRNGTKYEFAFWQYGLCEEFDIFVDKQMLQTIRELKLKVAALRQVKEDFNVHFVLQIVPSVYVDDITPP